MDKLKENYKPALVVICIILIPVIIALILKKDDTNSERVKKESMEIKNYAINEVIPVYINDESLVKKYYSDYMDLIINEPKKAFALLDDESLMEKFDSYNAFQKYVNTLKSTKGFYDVTVRNYANELVDGKRCYYVIDSIGKEYVFVEKAIMDYTVIVR